MRLIVFLGLFLPIMLSGLSVYFFKINTKVLKLLVAFSGAYLISLIFNELVPQIYYAVDHIQHEHDASCAHGHHHHSTHHVIGLLILSGFFLQLILDYLTKGVEHGHLEHHHESHHNHTANVMSISLWPLMIGLCLHSFLEGMPLAREFDSVELQNKLLIGIIVHNIPISIVLATLMLHNNIKRPKAIIFLLIFALSAPAGALFTNLLGAHFIADADMFFKYTMAVVVGIFLHISTTILFESDQNHRFNFIKFIVMVAGALAALIHF